MSADSHSLATTIADCMVRDRHRLRRELQRLGARPQPERLESLKAAIAESQAQVAARRERLPRPGFPPELPVAKQAETLIAAIQKHQVIIVAGETGSGKTTQLPKLCLAAGRGVTGLIGHTQPRRIAARSVAHRIASELKSELGGVVGYKVRFSDRTRPQSYIKLMTDGILLAEIQADRFLDQYDTLIIDEAHERSLNIDFLLGYLKQILPKRPDIKLIITSATINTALFAHHFNDAPVIEVSGRMYPVETRYRPLLTDDEDARERDLEQAVVEAVDECAAHGPGDMLIFLPGEREIRDCAEALRKRHPPHAEILPLYARLSVAEQDKVFQPHTGRRIVLATNVAETSLTVPGIHYVIDSGLARISRYSHRTKVQRLPIEKISQASANQRAGRCGRVGPGVCLRLYDEADFLARPEYTDAEIRRSNLAGVVLQMKALRLGDIENFPFVEPPETKMINDGYRLLDELGALDQHKALTDIGRKLAALPIDPRLGRMVLEAVQEQCLAELLVIAAALSVADPRQRPAGREAAADACHRRYADARSDFISLLNLWRDFHAQARELSKNKLRRWCEENFLSPLRMREWHDIHAQLQAMVKDMGWHLNEQPADPVALHHAILAGLIGQIACRTEQRDYAGARGVKLQIFPGSAVAAKPPKWIVAAELVETTRLWARTVAAVEPEWIERVGGRLCRHHYYDPHWAKKAAAVLAYDRITLFGLVLDQARRVHYGRINPVESRDIFIRAALVECEFVTHAPFFRHNQQLVQEIEAMEARLRRRDLLVDEETLFRFYDARIPEDVCDGRSFEHWRRQVEQTQPRLLFLTREELQRMAPAAAETDYPAVLVAGGVALSLSYRFAPGDPEDGVTATVPLSVLNLLSPASLEWLVPGLLTEKITALLRALPKALRRHFVPVPDYAAACVAALRPGDVSLTAALRGQLNRMSGIDVPEDAWADAVLPEHLRMNFHVVDDHGKVLATGRDLLQLQQQFGAQAKLEFARRARWSGERSGLTAWAFDELPRRVELATGAAYGHPALIDRGEHVDLTVLDNEQRAAQETHIGIRRLVQLQVTDKVKYLRKELRGRRALCLHYAPLGNLDALEQDMLAAIVDQAFLAGTLPRNRAEFDACLAKGRQAMMEVAQRLFDSVERTLAQFHAVTAELARLQGPAVEYAVADIRGQLDQLIYPGFIVATPAQWLVELPRYLAAIAKRLEKLREAPARDKQLTLELLPLWQQYLACVARRGSDAATDAALTRYRWMLEELRVSLFAQALKVKLPVSVQRLKRQWAELGC